MLLALRPLIDPPQESGIIAVGPAQLAVTGRTITVQAARSVVVGAAVLACIGVAPVINQSKQLSAATLDITGVAVAANQTKTSAAATLDITGGVISVITSAGPQTINVSPATLDITGNLVRANQAKALAAATLDITGGTVTPISGIAPTVVNLSAATLDITGGIVGRKLEVFAATLAITGGQVISWVPGAPQTIDLEAAGIVLYGPWPVMVQAGPSGSYLPTVASPPYGERMGLRANGTAYLGWVQASLTGMGEASDPPAGELASSFYVTFAVEALPTQQASPDEPHVIAAYVEAVGTDEILWIAVSPNGRLIAGGKGAPTISSAPGVVTVGTTAKTACYQHFLGEPGEQWLWYGTAAEDGAGGGVALVLQRTLIEAYQKPDYLDIGRFQLFQGRGSKTRISATVHAMRLEADASDVLIVWEPRIGTAGTSGRVYDLKQSYLDPAPLALPYGPVPTTAAPAIIMPGVAHPRVTGRTVTPTLASGQTIYPPAAHLVVAGRPITIAQQATVYMVAGALDITGLAPRINRTVPVGAATLDITGAVPSILRAMTVAVSPATLDITGLAPTKQLQLVRAVGAAILALRGQQPTIITTTQIVVGVSPASLVMHGAVVTPSVGGATVAVGPATLAIGHQAVTVGGVSSIAVGAAHLILAGQVVEVAGLGSTIAVGAGTLELQPQAVLGTAHPAAAHLQIRGLAVTPTGPGTQLPHAIRLRLAFVPIRLRVEVGRPLWLRFEVTDEAD